MIRWCEVWFGYCYCLLLSLAFHLRTITSGWQRETNSLTNPPPLFLQALFIPTKAEWLQLHDILLLSLTEGFRLLIPMFNVLDNTQSFIVPV